MIAQGLAGGIETSYRRDAQAPGGRLARPREGDVVASKRSARADTYDIRIIPASAHATLRRHAHAMTTVESLARQLQVDGWYTSDHTHHARVASYRRS